MDISICAERLRHHVAHFLDSCDYKKKGEPMSFTQTPHELKALFQCQQDSWTLKEFLKKVLDPTIALVKTQTNIDVIRTVVEEDGRVKLIKFVIFRRVSTPFVSPNTSYRPDSRSFDSLEDIATCTDRKRLSDIYSDNLGFLQGILCELDTSMRGQTLATNAAIKKRLTELKK